MKISKLLYGVGALAIIGGAFVLCQAFAGKPKEYITDTASIGTLANEVEVTGVVHGEIEKTYYSEITAPISMLNIKAGDTVSNGQKIVEYDTWDLENIFAEAKLSVESSQSSADGQVKDSNKKAAIYNKAASDVETYKFLYAWARNETDGIDISQYQENWDIATVEKCMNASIADKKYQITKLSNDLYKEDDIDEIKKINEKIDDLEESIAGINKDIANLPLAQKNPEEYKKYIADSNWMTDIRTNWTQSQTQANTYEGQILNSSQKEALYKNVEAAQLSADIAAQNLDTALNGISSDMNGIVTEVCAETGSVVAKGTPIFSLESSDDVKVDVEISKYDIGDISEGQRASINISGVDYDGTVSKINRFATGGTSDNAKIKVSVKINNPNDRVFLGIQADVTIYTEERDNTLIIPREAYYSDDTGDYVYVIENAEVDKKYIKTGIVNDEKVEVTSGISNGCVVIVDAVTDDDLGVKAVSK